MLEYKEVTPLPQVCQSCEEKEWGCDECDHFGERFVLDEKSKLELSKKGKQKTIERLKREIAHIDMELERLQSQ